MKIIAIIFITFLFVCCSSEEKNKLLNEKSLFVSGNRIDALDSLGLTIKDIEIYNNNIYILDQMNYRVCVLDSNYKLIKKIGKKGNGPGEFYFFPVDIKISFDKIYVLIDRQLNLFDLDGNFIKRVLVEASMSNIEVNDQDSTILISTPISPNDKQEDIHIYTVLNNNCEILKKITIKSKYLSKAKAIPFTQTLIKNIGDKIIVNEIKEDIFHIFDLNNNYIKTIKGNNKYLVSKRLKNPDNQYGYTYNDLIELNNNYFAAIVTQFSTKYETFLDIYDNNINYKGKILFDDKYNDKIKLPSFKIIGNDAFIMSNEKGNIDIYKIPKYKQIIDDILKKVS